MIAYYNENDPKAAAWLRELIKAGHIADGFVDERSIVDVKPGELFGFRQCHFFAGIGGWSYALRLAGWPDGRPVWTGSCPCQPFSVANSRRKAVDERDLFGVWADLIRESRPAVVFGEQVASPLGLNWFDTVRTDLENEGYAVGGADLCAAGVGAPHIRQRLYWVALGNAGGAGSGWNPGTVLSEEGSIEGGVWSQLNFIEPASPAGGWVGDSHGEGSQGRGLEGDGPRERVTWPSGVASDWVLTGDKWRPTEPGTFPLVARLPKGMGPVRDPRESINATDEARVMRLKGYGNAICPQVAEAFVRACAS